MREAGQAACSVGWWLVADGWCWFILREKYYCLVAGGWFALREKYGCLVADKPSEQGLFSSLISFGLCQHLHFTWTASSPEGTP
jgi:hypothetical protein